MVKEKVHEYDAVLSNLIQEFDSRFEDFRHNTADFELFAQPFTISVDAVRDDLQMELIEHQCDSELKHKFTSLPLTDFYKCVTANRYPKMCKQAQVMLSLFGSTYLCEQTFSLMNLNKSKLRSKITDSHLHNILSLSVSQLQPNLEKLLKNKDQSFISLIRSLTLQPHGFIIASVFGIELYCTLNTWGLFVFIVISSLKCKTLQIKLH